MKIVKIAFLTAALLLSSTIHAADEKPTPIRVLLIGNSYTYFNNVPDRVVSYSQGRMAEPLLKVPSPEQERELAALLASV